MARPRSEEKRQTILLAATKLFAEEGLNASTASIAKAAGVAEGTVFTYFATKDELLNQLYLTLKEQLHSAASVPDEKDDLRDKLWHAWHTYIGWGLKHPDAHQVLAKLSMSGKITQATRDKVQDSFCGIIRLIEDVMVQGVICHQPPVFGGLLMVSMADTTMNFIKKNPDEAYSICKDGFSAFWNAISSG